MKAANYKDFGKEKLEPKEFHCRNIGIDCLWKHVARTEDLLLDAAALHLRDVHGEIALSEERLAQIKRSFVKPTQIIVETVSDIPVMKELRCRDIGMQCDWKYLAQTEELIVDGVAVHAREAHGLKEFTPEMIAKVKRAIREWKEETVAA
jgi:predicted small metal-binding protein